MKISVDEQNNLVLTEVYNSVLFRTAEGNTVAICMRDDTVELTVAGSDRWYRANMDTGDFVEC